ncbi:NADPH-dependent FMN reductase [Sphingopyxis alaskensis]|jgi:FMN reductase|uniref:NADPH-dependent FMN reductase n=1 Tax=Sphingopyxis alaskensis TaxID=117207 RepID=UPI0003245125|nr:NAD(P)H-dependent oxidoreductase [Sphingopyxis alaskensis]MCM3419812.1 NAD(P)H-dependent oxidoreductase [Sphingopyxis alaskensis]
MRVSINIVAIGGTVSPISATEQALCVAAARAKAKGAHVDVFGGSYLGALPHYRGPLHGPDDGARLVAAVRAADGILIAAPGYHGTISGLVKNALDYLEDLAGDARPYLDGRAVGLIATAYGDQATMSTMQTLRSIVHALRGWPTPMGATVRTYRGLFSPDGECLEDRARFQLELVADQLVSGASSFAAARKVA